MLNFDKIATNGVTWSRCNRVIVENPYGAEKTCKFFVEDVVSINNKIVKTDRGMLQKSYNPQETIPMRDPETGALTGETVTHEYLYQILQSLFVKAAQEVN